MNIQGQQLEMNEYFREKYKSWLANRVRHLSEILSPEFIGVLRFAGPATVEKWQSKRRSWERELADLTTNPNFFIDMGLESVAADIEERKKLWFWEYFIELDWRKSV